MGNCKLHPRYCKVYIYVGWIPLRGSGNGTGIISKATVSYCIFLVPTEYSTESAFELGYFRARVLLANMSKKGNDFAVIQRLV